MVEILSNEDNRQRNRVKEAVNDSSLKGQLSLAFFIFPLVRAIMSFLMCVIMVANVLTSEKVQLPTVSEYESFMNGVIPKVDYRIVTLMLHLIIILPLSSLNMVSGYRVHMIPKVEMTVRVMAQHYTFATLWFAYAVLLVALIFIFAPTYASFLITLIPEVFLDGFAYVTMGQILKGIPEWQMNVLSPEPPLLPTDLRHLQPN